jgi:hypothetical protein
MGRTNRVNWPIIIEGVKASTDLQYYKGEKKNGLMVGWFREFATVPYICNFCNKEQKKMTLMTQMPLYASSLYFCPDCFPKFLDELKLQHEDVIQNRAKLLLLHSV